MRFDEGASERRFVCIGDIGGPEGWHVGDEAMLSANLSGLRECFSRAKFTLVSADPDWSEKVYGEQAIANIGFDGTVEDAHAVQRADEILELADVILSHGSRDRARSSTELSPVRIGSPSLRRACRLVEEISRCDAVVVSGGGNLCATWPAHLHERTTILRLAKRSNKPFVVLGQTIGPELTGVQRGILTEVLRSAALVIARERSTARLLQELGIDSRKTLLSLDDAFFLRPRAPRTIPPCVERNKPWIAVTLTARVFAEREATVPTETASQLDEVARRTGASLTFIPHVAGEDVGLSDLPSTRAIAERLSPDTPFEILPVHGTAETVWLTQRSSMVLSMRYHPIVFGLAGGIPSIGLYVDEYTKVKLRGALEFAGLADLTLDFESERSKIAETSASVWSRRETLRHDIEERRPEWEGLERTRWKRVVSALALPVDQASKRQRRAPQ